MGSGRPPERRRGDGQQARAGRVPWRRRLLAWLRLNAQTLLASLGRLYRRPIGTLMTAAVIGVALALPAGLYVLLTNLQAVSGGWQGGAQISLFLRMDVDDGAARALGRRLGERGDVARVEVLGREQALAEFRQLSGFGEALDALGENPLPAVVVLRPTAEAGAPARIDALVEELRALPEVDLAQLDLQWVKRLYAIMEVSRRGVLVVAGMLSLAVLLIVGNTIRLDIENRREEILITKLIGATRGFVRRPFLYSGMWYGLLGGAIAWAMITISLALLEGPARHLAVLYGSGFRLSGLGSGTTVLLLGGGMALGLLGSWLAVGRHLDAIEPG